MLILQNHYISSFVYLLDLLYFCLYKLTQNDIYFEKHGATTLTDEAETYDSVVYLVYVKKDKIDKSYASAIYG